MGREMMRLACAFVAILMLAGFCGSPSAFAQKAETNNIMVFAAASLKNAIDRVSGAYSKDTGRKVVVSYASSSALARQIEQGAPADIFVSADLDWMDYLSQRGLIDPTTRSNLLGNRLVLIAPASRSIALKIAPGFDLESALGGGKLAMGAAMSVPAGRYGKAALESLGVWDKVKANVVEGENVRAALALVARREAAMGITYQTDALVERSVRVVDIFPDGSHPEIVYPVAAVAGSKAKDVVADFLRYLKSPAAREAFEQEGFVTK